MGKPVSCIVINPRFPYLSNLSILSLFFSCHVFIPSSRIHLVIILYILKYLGIYLTYIYISHLVHVIDPFILQNMPEEEVCIYKFPICILLRHCLSLHDNYSHVGLICVVYFQGGESYERARRAAPYS